MERWDLAAAASLLLLAGCGGASTTTTAPVATDPEPAPAPEPEPAASDRLEPPACPSAATNCARASGVIVYVEKLDADGDGDAHFVLTSTESVTGPGISVIDVRADLRPDPLPKPGQQLAAAGPVYRGSFGQLQIEATEIRVGPAP